MFTRFAGKAVFASLSAAAAFVNIAVAAPAQAADYDDRSVQVRYDDLDVASASGAAQLSRRIANAAREVCGPADMRVLAQSGPARACRTAAIASAEPQVQLVLAMAGQGERHAGNRAIVVASR